MRLEFSTDDLTDDSYKLLMETATLSLCGPDGEDRLDLSDLDLEADIEVDLANFQDQQIIDEYQKRFGIDENVVGRAYELIGAGRVDDAMDLLADEFRLPPPYHEKRIAALIARGRAKEALHAQS